MLDLRAIVVCVARVVAWLLVSVAVSFLAAEHLLEEAELGGSEREECEQKADEELHGEVCAVAAAMRGVNVSML